MSLAQIMVLVILVVALALIVASRLRADIAAMAMVVALGLAQFAGLGMLGPANRPADAVKAVSGFGQPVVITLLSLFMITRCLEKSGITRWIARYLLRLGGQSETRLIALFAGATAFLSLFMNNLAAGALLLPSALEASRRTGIRPSKLLIPVAYGSLLGGVATYFTTANIIVSGLLEIAQPPQAPLRILDFAPTGGLIAVIGIAFLAIFGRRLLPDRATPFSHFMSRPTGSQLEDMYQLGERLWEGHIQPESSLVGKSLSEAAIGEKLGVIITAIWRGSRIIFPLYPAQTFEAGDTVWVVGREERVSRLTGQGLLIEKRKASQHISSHGLTLVELMPAPRSGAVGHTLKELVFRSKYGFTAIALWRKGRSYRTNVADFKLEVGDTLLVIGTPDQIKQLHNTPDFIVLEPSDSDQPIQRRPALISVSVVLAAVAASILGVPVYLAMLGGAIAIVVSGLLTMEEAYRAIEWQAIFLIAGMYSVSLALVQTGLADLIGRGMVSLVRPLGPLGLAAGAYLLTALLTQVMGGQVTALVTGPVAISAAISLHTHPQAIAVATAIGCSASFMTPLAHPVNMMMIAPANYTFADFFRIGWRLTLISFVVLLAGMVLFWGL